MLSLALPVRNPVLDFVELLTLNLQIFMKKEFLRHQGGAEGGRGGGAAPPSFGVAQCRGFSPDPFPIINDLPSGLGVGAAGIMMFCAILKKNFGPSKHVFSSNFDVFGAFFFNFGKL